MSLELFIAKRLYKTRNGEKRLSKPAVVIAQWGVAIGIIVMIASISIVIGFKHEIQEKIIGFGGHIQVRNYSAWNDGEMPVTAEKEDIEVLKATDGVAHIQGYINKPGLIAAGEEFEGIILKGIGEGYDTSFFLSNIEEGTIPNFSDTIASNKIVVSRNIAQKLNVHLGDKLNIYFVQDGVRARRMTIEGIYNTNMGELDNIIAITDIYTARRLNRWNDNQYTGLEFTVQELNNIDATCIFVGEAMDKVANKHQEQLYVQTVEEMNPALFAWLNLLDQTVWIILVLVIGISGFTIISGLLILILEKTNLIGILKALGAKNISIRKIFLYYSMFIIGRGMLWGNIIGLLLCLLQQQTGIIGLDPEMYYMSQVPIEFSWILIPMNIVMFIISVCMLVLPSMFISRIEPTKAIRFE